MVDGIGSHVCGTNIVVPEYLSVGDQDPEINEERFEPTNSKNAFDCPRLRFCARAR